jgi:hypothetical protein
MRMNTARRPLRLALVPAPLALLVSRIGLAGPHDFSPIENPEVQPVFGGVRPWRDSQPSGHAQRLRQTVLALLVTMIGSLAWTLRHRAPVLEKRLAFIERSAASG